MLFLFLVVIPPEAESYLGTTVTDAVVTVCHTPLLRIIDDTVTLARYGLHKKPSPQPCNVLTFYLGGGAFDVSQLRRNP
jgi:molecular chaperone DnaK (HSP70)